jgi:ERCC4-type nuclease
VEVEESILSSGDIEIIGHGPDDRPILVGVEYKLVGEVLACVRDGRFAGQLRAMRGRYEVRWLLVEGQWAPGSRGELLVVERGRFREARGQYTYAEVASWLLTMAQAGGALLWRTQDRAESVSWLCALHSWWVERDWASHRSHLAIHTPPLFSFVPPTPVEEVAMRIPGLGPEKAKNAGKVFASPLDLCGASEERWLLVDGVGKALAARATAWCSSPGTVPTSPAVGNRRSIPRTGSPTVGRARKSG